MSSIKFAAVGVVVLVVLLAGVEFNASRTAPARAQEVAGPAAATLGLDLATFSGPAASGSHFFGTQSFHWERRGIETSDRLSLLPSEERLCWSSGPAGSRRDHGCIVAKEK